MKRELTCIICPIGCMLTVDIESGRVTKVFGNTCSKGKAYAEEECISPKRTLTTTVLTKSGRPVACKTLTPIPKESVISAMKIINSYKIDLPISIGDVIIEDVYGANIIATQNMEKV